MNKSPGQASGFTSNESHDQVQFTLGLTCYLFQNDREIARVHLNYAAGHSFSGRLGSHIFVMVMQLRFIPI